MGHPTLKTKGATLINLALLLVIFFSTLLQTSNISKPDIKKNIPLPQNKNIPLPLDTESKLIGNINTQRIIKADNEPGNWLSHGRNYEEQRYSPLEDINKENIERLNLAWSFDMNSTRALEATPIIDNGVMFLTSEWSIVHAIDAKTGEEIWSYDPLVPKAWGRKACCDVVNRGVAVWNGNVFFASLDGRLIKLNAGTGKLIWEVNTLIDRNKDYTITGAPRIANNKIFIGNGGAEYGVRGYVSAYNTDSGSLVWRFYTVPGDPSLPFEHPELEEASKTWKGGEWWKIGGGGTVWNTIVYDPDFNNLYIGVGNGSPWTRVIRSPGGGDNLFLSSIVALDADTGKMKWYYQTTPGDNWDYTATQDIMLADMQIDGTEKKVLMQAPKNGFFYVLDRKNGELLRAHKYTEVNWATHVDLETGRPIENPEKDYTNEKQWILPGALGGHNWQAMSYDPDLGLVFIPEQKSTTIYQMTEEWQQTGKIKYKAKSWNTGIEIAKYLDLALTTLDAPIGTGSLKAFDPISGETKWEVKYPQHWNGGTLSTKSGLTFQGNGMGALNAFDSSNGEILWSKDIQTSMIAPPVTYKINNEQYIVILAGTGGGNNHGGDTLGFHTEHVASLKYGNNGRLLAFKIDGKKTLPRLDLVDRTIPEQPKITSTEFEISRGKELYGEYCAFCHGTAVRSGPALPDLRMMSNDSHELFNEIVYNGIYSENGMTAFSDVMSKNDVNNIYHYIVDTAKNGRKIQQATK